MIPQQLALKALTINCCLLQLLRTYIDKECEEQHLPLALYAYRAAAHSSTGVSPHMLMFGREPNALIFDIYITGF